MCPEIIKNRSILKVSGNDSESFLQGLITNDVSRAKTELIYTALLSPKGKYLFENICLIFLLLRTRMDI